MGARGRKRRGRTTSSSLTSMSNVGETRDGNGTGRRNASIEDDEELTHENKIQNEHGGEMHAGLRQTEKIVHYLFNRNDSGEGKRPSRGGEKIMRKTGAFREPVDWKEMGLLDYPMIIKKPMDLGTVKKRLERGEYRTPEEAANDIRLIWSNCMLYNQVSRPEAYRIYYDLLFRIGVLSTILQQVCPRNSKIDIRRLRGKLSKLRSMMIVFLP